MARIVSLVPSLTELACELGLADELVGRTGFCIHPRQALRRVPKVGGTKSVNLDKVRALEPSHVVLNVDENRKEDADALARFVPNLVVTHPLAPLDNLALYRQFGSVFGREREAEALCARFQAAYDGAAAARLPERRVLYLIWKDPWMTVSPDTYISRTLAVFGLRTVPEAVTTRYPEIEDLHGVDADLVLLSSEPYRFRDQHRRDVEALTGKPALLIDGEMTSWYGPRAIAGLAYLRDFTARAARAGSPPAR
ncbi:MAG TPA: helical backbone metal receptor [Burkholderiales bacterium]|nr:helical backbone metal receptor [Burkholderiales bacterium]